MNRIAWRRQILRVLQMDNTKNFSIHHGNGTVVIYPAFFENAPKPKIKSLFALAQKWFRANAGVIARMSEHLYMRREECRKDAAVAKKNYSDLYQAPGWENGTAITDKKIIRKQELSNKRLAEQVKKCLAKLEKIESVCEIFNEKFRENGFQIND